MRGCNLYAYFLENINAFDSAVSLLRSLYWLYWVCLVQGEIPLKWKNCQRKSKRDSYSYLGRVFFTILKQLSHIYSASVCFSSTVLPFFLTFTPLTKQKSLNVLWKPHTLQKHIHGVAWRGKRSSCILEAIWNPFDFLVFPESEELCLTQLQSMGTCPFLSHAPNIRPHPIPCFYRVL